MSTDKQKEYIKLYREANKDKIAAKRKLYREANKDKIKIYDKAYKETNKERLKEYGQTYDKVYKETNKERLKEYGKAYRETNKEHLRLLQSNRRKNNPLYRLSCDIRSMIGEFFRSKGISKTLRTEQILGCSFDEFKAHLESKFEPWMNWNNKGLYNSEFDYGWDIDHIKPISKAKTVEDVIRLNHYNNLQPLCSKINRDIKRNN